MKKIQLFLLVLTVFMIQACSAEIATEAAAPQEPVNPPEAATNVPNTPEVIQSAPEGSTSVALNALPPVITETLSAGSNVIPENGITLEGKDKTYNLKVGDTFLLNLGSDVYDWTVTVDNETILHLKMGVMVIQGAQGLYEALAAGTAILSATGDPKCRQSNPPCGAPSILFTITVIVE